MSIKSKIRDRIRVDSKLAGAIREQVSQNQHAGEGELRRIGLEKVDRNPSQTQQRRLPVSIEQINDLRETALRAGPLGSQAFFEALSQTIERFESEEIRTVLEKLYLLAKSIHAQGLIQPIRVYDKASGRYEVNSGERRYLAHVLLGRPTITALVKESEGNEFEELVGTLVENINREDLSTKEKIEFIEELVGLYEKVHPGKTVTVEVLHEIIHESIRTCYRYLSYIKAPTDVREAIRTGELSTVTEIDEAIKGVHKPETTRINQPAKQKLPNTKKQKFSRGRQKTSIALGKTERPDLVKTLMEKILGKGKITTRYGDLDWTDLTQVEKAWAGLMKELEMSQAEDAK